jgi:hypothetical protein
MRRQQCGRPGCAYLKGCRVAASHTAAWLPCAARGTTVAGAGIPIPPGNGRIGGAGAAAALMHAPLQRRCQSIGRTAALWRLRAARARSTTPRERRRRGTGYDEGVPHWRAICHLGPISSPSDIAARRGGHGSADSSCLAALRRRQPPPRVSAACAGGGCRRQGAWELIG